MLFGLDLLVEHAPLEPQYSLFTCLKALLGCTIRELFYQHVKLNLVIYIHVFFYISIYIYLSSYIDR